MNIGMPANGRQIVRRKRHEVCRRQMARDIVETTVQSVVFADDRDNKDKSHGVCADHKVAGPRAMAAMGYDDGALGHDRCVIARPLLREDIIRGSQP